MPGTLVLTYSRSRYDGILKRMLWDMVKIGGAVFILGTLITMVLSMLLFNRTMKGFVRVSRMLGRIESGARITPDQISALSPLEQRFVNICLPVQTALDRANQVMASIRPPEPKTGHAEFTSPREEKL